MNLKPTGQNIVVKPADAPKQTDSGILLATGKNPDHWLTGKVAAIGPGRALDDGKTIPLEVKVGDTLLWARQHGVKVMLDGEDLMILPEDNVLAVLES